MPLLLFEQVERFNRIILDALSTKIHERDDRIWNEFVPDAQIGINSIVHKTTKKSPSEIVSGFRVTGTTKAILSDVINDTLKCNFTELNMCNDTEGRRKYRTTTKEQRKI